MLSYTLFVAGDTARVTAVTDESLVAARRVGNPTSLCFAALCAGLYGLDAHPDEALAMLALANEAGQSVGNQLGMGTSLASAAIIHVKRGEWTKAAPFAARSVEHFLRAGDRHWFGEHVATVAVILAGLKVDEPAAVLFGTNGVAVHVDVAGPYAPLITEAEAAVKKRLGDRRFTISKARGAAMDDDQVASLVRVELSRIREAEASSSTPTQWPT